jgi:hypothetical protein
VALLRTGHSSSLGGSRNQTSCRDVFGLLLHKHKFQQVDGQTKKVFIWLSFPLISA